MKTTYRNNVDILDDITMTQDKQKCQSDLTKHRGGVSPRSKCPCVRYVFPILNMWIIISSRRGKRNKLITFTLGSIACSLFWVSEFQGCHYISAWVRIGELGLQSEWGTVKSDTGRSRTAFVPLSAAELPASLLQYYWGWFPSQLYFDSFWYRVWGWYIWLSLKQASGASAEHTTENSVALIWSKLRDIL